MSSVFARHGEAAFRTLERQAIERLMQGEPGVIALGGGAFQASSVREELLRNALVFWLDVPEDMLVGRLRRSGGRSPGRRTSPCEASPSVRRTPHQLCVSSVRIAAVPSAEMTAKIWSVLD